MLSIACTAVGGVSEFIYQLVARHGKPQLRLGALERRLHSQGVLTGAPSVVPAGMISRRLPDAQGI